MTNDAILKIQRPFLPGPNPIWLGGGWVVVIWYYVWLGGGNMVLRTYVPYYMVGGGNMVCITTTWLYGWVVVIWYYVSKFKKGGPMLLYCNTV